MNSQDPRGAIRLGGEQLCRSDRNAEHGTRPAPEGQLTGTSADPDGRQLSGPARTHLCRVRAAQLIKPALSEQCRLPRITTYTVQVYAVIGQRVACDLPVSGRPWAPCSRVHRPSTATFLELGAAWLLRMSGSASFNRDVHALCCSASDEEASALEATATRTSKRAREQGRVAWHAALCGNLEVVPLRMRQRLPSNPHTVLEM